jgi:DNA helicase-2/ATP-dependent DNA helicase PcrA
MDEVVVKHTKQQLAAIEHNDGPALVVAGAGTGKTAVITQRIARLILGGKAKPEQVLALTFTEKAAAEMQQRVDELLPYGYVDTQIMTFHALAEKLLREYALDIGLSPEFQILNDVQQIIIMQKVLERADFEYFSPQHDPFAFIAAVRQAISRLKDEGIDALEYQKRLKKLKSLDDDETLKPLKELGEIYNRYESLCKQKNVLDFGDLLIKLQHLLNIRVKIRREISGRYKYILVDEFQDTNTIQMEILRKILTKSNNIMAVGDDDQAIYRFRGASVQNILNFRKIFPESKLIVLKENFRSGQAILDAGYRLIQQNNPQRLEVSEKIDKQLVAQTNPDAKVKVTRYRHKLAEVDGVIDKIQSLLKKGVEQKNIAILFRKNNQIKPYIQALNKHQLQYFVHQDVELFDQQSVKTMVALANCITDLHNSSALFQLLVSNFFTGIDRHTVVALSASSKRQNKSLYDYIMENGDATEVAACQQLWQWQELISSHTAGELMFVAIKQTKYLARLLQEAEESPQVAQEIQYMTDFFRLVKQFELVAQSPNLVELCLYLDEIKLSSADIMSEISPLDISGIQLMTIHRAKGLEFDYVFIPELTEQTFPTHRRAELIRIPDEIIGSTEGDHYQEERRLFYVGLTRARKGVELSFATDHGGKRPKKPSRFVLESVDESAILDSVSSKQRSMDEIIRSFAPVKKGEARNLLNRLYKGEWLYLTTNQIADYLRSPREFWLFHVLQLPKGPFHSLVYGSAIHAALEHFYKYQMKGKKVTINDLITVFEQSWQSEGFVSADHEKRLFETGKRVLRRYYIANQNNPQKPLAIEQPFELQIPNLKTVIVGRYDIVLKSKEGVEIRDFKTSRVKDQKAANDKAKDSIQLGIYALAWEKLQHTPVSDISLEFVEDLIIGKAPKIDNAKTLEAINRAVVGIKDQKFEKVGQSNVDFDKLLI